PEIAEGILAAVTAGLAVKPEDCPKVDGERDPGQVDSALADLLRVLLKAKSEGAGVAQKLIATSSDLDALASGDRSVAALKGWRGEVFNRKSTRLNSSHVKISYAVFCS